MYIRSLLRTFTVAISKTIPTAFTFGTLGSILSYYPQILIKHCELFESTTNILYKLLPKKGPEVRLKGLRLKADIC